jgi:hypothetical protein
VGKKLKITLRSTYSMPSRRRVIVHKPKVLRLVNTYSVSTTARHFIISWGRLIQSILNHKTPTSHLRLHSDSGKNDGCKYSITGRSSTLGLKRETNRRLEEKKTEYAGPSLFLSSYRAYWLMNIYYHTNICTNSSILKTDCVYVLL